MSAGAWRAADNSFPYMQRWLHDGVLSAYEAEAGCGWDFEPFGQHPACPHGLPIGDQSESLAAAMEAADLWATEHGYPAVRVEVDP